MANYLGYLVYSSEFSQPSNSSRGTKSSLYSGKLSVDPVKMLCKIWNLTVIFILFGTCFSQTTNILDSLEKKLSESGDSIPNFNKSRIDPEKIENVLREKCEQQKAGDAIDLLKNQQDAVKECFTRDVNVTQIELELEEAKKTGSMDEVFAKYCRKWPSVYTCFDNVTATVRRCMTAREEKSFNKTLDIVQELQEFMCFKEGDRLAMFVAEGGVECIQEQQEGIKDCFNSTLGAKLPEENDLSVATLPTFLFTDDDCQDFEKVRTCINGVLEKCKDTTPANIIDASFKFLRKQMTCKEDGGQPAESAKALSSKANQVYTFINLLPFTLGVYFINRYAPLIQ